MTHSSKPGSAAPAGRHLSSLSEGEIEEIRAKAGKGYIPQYLILKLLNERESLLSSLAHSREGKALAALEELIETHDEILRTKEPSDPASELEQKAAFLRFTLAKVNARALTTKDKEGTDHG